MLGVTGLVFFRTSNRFRKVGKIESVTTTKNTQDARPDLGFFLKNDFISSGGRVEKVSQVGEVLD